MFRTLILLLVSCSPISTRDSAAFTAKEKAFLKCLCTSYYQDLHSAHKEREWVEVSCVAGTTIESFSLGYREWVKPCNANFEVAE